MTRQSVLALLLASALLTPPALALDDKDKAVRMERAHTLLAISGAGKVAEQMVTAMLARARQQAIQQNPGHEAEIKSLLDEYFLPEIKAGLPELTRGMAGVYASNFTATEMDEIIAFYNTPVGAKLVQNLPIIVQQSMAVGQVWGKGVGERAAGKFIEAMKQRGLKTPQKL